MFCACFERSQRRCLRARQGIPRSTHPLANSTLSIRRGLRVVERANNERTGGHGIPPLLQCHAVLRDLKQYGLRYTHVNVERNGGVNGFARSSYFLGNRTPPANDTQFLYYIGLQCYDTALPSPLHMSPHGGCAGASTLSGTTQTRTSPFLGLAAYMDAVEA